MCKTHAIEYTCRHNVRFRLSTCRGTHVYPHSGQRPGAKSEARCHSNPTLYLASHQRCGQCLRGEAEQQLKEAFAEAGVVLNESEVWGDDEASPNPDVEEYARRQFKIVKQFPLGTGKVFAKPEPNHSLVNRYASRARIPRASGSLLKCEVKPEDVVLTYEANPFEASEGWDAAACESAWAALEDDKDMFEFNYAPEFEDLGTMDMPELDSDDEDDTDSFKSSDASSDEEDDADIDVDPSTHPDVSGGYAMPCKTYELYHGQEHGTQVWGVTQENCTEA